jgi:hypothetical protein
VDINIKSISQKIAGLYFRDVGYGELEKYLYNTLKDLFTKSYEEGAKDKAETLREIKKNRDRIMERKFKELLNKMM